MSLAISFPLTVFSFLSRSHLIVVLILLLQWANNCSVACCLICNSRLFLSLFLEFISKSLVCVRKICLIWFQSSSVYQDVFCILTYHICTWRKDQKNLLILYGRFFQYLFSPFGRMGHLCPIFPYWFSVLIHFG